MKKKLLLIAIMAVALVCLFAVAVSAAQIPEWSEITEVGGMPDKSTFGADGTKGATSRVLMSDGVTYPAYYICNNSMSLGISFTDINTKTGKSYSASSVVRIEVPKGTVSSPMSVFKTEIGYTSLLTVVFPEGFTTMGGYTFKATESVASALVEVTLPSTLTKFSINEFIYCTELEELIIPEGVTTIPASFAYGATSLKTIVLPSTIQTIEESAFRSANLENGVIIPEGCTKVGNYAFKGAGMVKLVVPSTVTTFGSQAFQECSKLKEVYFKASKVADSIFENCYAIETIIFEGTTIIGNRAFTIPSGNLSSLKTLILCEGITSIGEYAFARSGISSVILPSTLTQISTSVFKDAKNLEKVTVLGSVTNTDMFSGCTKLSVLVVTEKYTTFGTNTLKDAVSNFKTYYTGTDYSRLRGFMTSSRVQNSANCTYADYLAGNYKSNNLLIYGANLCDVSYNGEHNEGDLENYQATCTRCGAVVYCEDPAHSQKITIEYESFLTAGTKTVVCLECNTAGRKVETAPLFVCLGYSASQYGDGISIGFKANGEAIAKYREATGKSVTYGVFAVSKEKLGDNDIFGANGVADGVINAEITNESIAVFELKITGFTDGTMNAKIAIGAYAAVTNGESTEYSYMQFGTAAQGEKYCFTSYNDIIASI